MRLFYGADPAAFNPAEEVELHVLRTLKVQRRNVYDESNRDVIAQEVDIEVIAALNPAAVSYAGEIGVVPTRLPGMRSIVTFRAIRHKLMEERRVLRFLSDEPGQPEVTQTDLQSPAPVLAGQTPYTCDVLGGPYPQDCHVVAYWGEPKTILLYYRIKTYVNECDQLDGHPVLSHRWSQRSDTDHDHFSTRISEGTVYFNVAELVRRGQIPDQFRGDLFPAVPTNFQREHGQVLVTPDGSQLRYVVVDREKSHLFNNQINATRIEVYHTEHSHQPSKSATRAMFARGMLQVAADVSLAALQAQGEVAGLAIPLAASARVALLGADLILAQQATFEASLFVRVWGDRTCSRENLARLAASVAVSRLENPAVLNLLPSRDMLLTRDLYGKFVELQLKIGHPPGTQSILFGVPAIAAADNELILAQGGSIDPGNGNTNPAFPNNSQTRGTWVGRLFAQALGEACGNPSLPVTVGNLVADDNGDNLSGQNF